MSKILSKETIKKLKAELERLKTEERKKVAERIKVARGFGDLSENAEYQIALEEQKRLENRIRELELLLRTAKVANNKQKDRVGVGSKVVLVDLKTKKEQTFEIVGFGEADPLANKISPESPLGKMLIGKKEGEEIKFNNKEFKIKKIL